MMQKEGMKKKKITPESDKRRQNRKTPLTPTGYGHFSLWRPFSLSREINKQNADQNLTGESN